MFVSAVLLEEGLGSPETKQNMQIKFSLGPFRCRFFTIILLGGVWTDRTDIHQNLKCAYTLALLTLLGI